MYLVYLQQVWGAAPNLNKTVAGDLIFAYYKTSNKEESMEEEIGKITHFFSKIDVGIIEVTTGELHVGDTIHIKGHTTDFYQKILSLQMEHMPVETVKAGKAAGLKVENAVREHDLVFKVKED